MRVTIIGAGLTDCTIARVLADNSYNVTVHERSNCCGGMTTDEARKSAILKNQ